MIEPGWVNFEIWRQGIISPVGHEHGSCVVKFTVTKGAPGILRWRHLERPVALAGAVNESIVHAVHSG